MKIKGVAATTLPFNIHSGLFQFSIEQLQMLARTAVGVSVTRDFLPGRLGVVSKAFVEDGNLIIEADLDNAELLDGWHIVPSYTSHDFATLEMSLTQSPADKSLPQVERLNLEE